ncbi:unnamed protein product [Rotaria sordida]|uniref:Uncharacterized protein n=1 Tax=Rotaria sordida TaxID=392033 RepID=A0A814K692_9BILA|nr:unnamed protein product [Rotaria sordida]CAF1052879.1 unnamed protein product [Rotaria sordida]
MNSIIIALYCLIFLVVQQRINAINCYYCGMGTDGCGPSFNTQGSGVITTTSNTSAVYCTKTKYVVKENKYLEEFLMQLAQYTESTCVLISTRSYEFSQGKTKIDITYPHR